MLNFFAWSCLLFGLAGCAAHPPTTPQAETLADQRSGAGDDGVVIALRPVPPTDSQPIKALLAGLGVAAGGAGEVEYIVQADDGSTLAVVQPRASLLRVGQRVSIRRGLRTSVGVPSGMLAAR